MSSRRKRHEEHEEHENHERWLVTYADMLTLLMVLFIVMFAMSQVDQRKYNALKNGLADGFGSTSTFMKGSDSILEHQSGDLSPDIASVIDKLTLSEKKTVARVLDSETQGSDMAAAKAEYSRLERIEEEIRTALSKQGLGDDVRTAIDDRGLVVSLVSKHVVFQPDVAQLSPRGQRVVDTLAPVLRGLDEQLRVDGHTNQVQVKPRYYATDWDLSAARAVTVLRRLNEVNHVPASRLSVSAFGHERPLVDPKVPGSQDVNKRVDIVVLPDVASSTRELLGEVAAEEQTSGHDSASDSGSESSHDAADTAGAAGAARAPSTTNSSGTTGTNTAHEEG